MRGYQRPYDLTVLALAYVVFLPAWVLAWSVIPLLILLSDGRPVFYRQWRLGRNGRPFLIIKFRTMVRDAEERHGPVWAAVDDPRVTRVGRVLRATRMDEIPQTINILRGDMSVVGPRPERPELAREFNLDTNNRRSYRVASDGTTFWVLDLTDNKLYGYTLKSTGADRDATRDIDLDNNGAPQGLWAEANLIWVGESSTPDHLVAYANPNGVLSLPEGPLSRDVDENAAAGANVGEPVAARGGIGETLEYGLTGPDAGSFAVDGSGQITVGSGVALNHETKSSYEVTVRVRDNKDEDANPDPTWDAMVVVEISVNNLDESGSITLSPSSPRSPAAMTATVTDPDGAVNVMTWVWAISDSMGGTFTVIGGATSASYTPVASDEAKFLKVTATYTDGQGPGKSAEVVTGAVGPESNDQPSLPAQGLQLNVDEDTAAGGVVGTVVARDPDGDPLEYEILGGDAGRFEINSGTGQVTVGAGTALDYETITSYSMTVRVRDKKDDDGHADTDWDDSRDLIIIVDDVNEPGVVSLRPSNPRVGRELTPTLMEEDGGVAGLVWSWHRSPDMNDWTFVQTGSSYTPVEADVDNYLRTTAVYSDVAGGAGQNAVEITECQVATAPSGGGIALHCDNDDARGLWTDGVTMWVSDTDNLLYGYTLSTGDRDDGKIITLTDDNDNPLGLWSDKTTMWVADWSDKKVYAYGLESGTRETAKEFGTSPPTSNNNPWGIWSDRTTMWVSMGDLDKLVAYTLSDGSRDEDQDITLHSDNGNAKGIWSDETTIWAVDQAAMKVFAYELDDGNRYDTLDLDLEGANAKPLGLASDGVTLWVSDGDDDVLYAYELPTEGINGRPKLPSGLVSRSVDENVVAGTAVGEPVVATDPDGNRLEYGLEGRDAALFTVDRFGGQIRVESGSELDYETQSAYEVTLLVRDNRDKDGVPDAEWDDTVAVEIKVNNVDEDGSITLSAPVPSLDARLDATLDDPDGYVRDLSWVWAIADRASGPFTNIPGATGAGYTPQEEDRGRYLRMTASYADGQGSGKTAELITMAVLSALPPAPREVHGQGSQQGIVVSWWTVPGADEYLVEYRKPGESEWSRVTAGDFRNVPSHSKNRRLLGVATGLECATGYDVRVSARGDGERYHGAFGAYAVLDGVMTGQCAEPDRATGLSVSVEPECATLSWTAPTDGDYTGVTVERTISGVSEGQEIYSGGRSATRHRDCSAEYGGDEEHRSHLYLVRYTDGDGNRSRWAYVSFTYGAQDQAVAPRNLRFTRNTGSERRLAWDPTPSRSLTVLAALRGERTPVSDPWYTGYQVERKQYRIAERRNQAGQTLMIITDSPGARWEVVRDFDEGGTGTTYVDSEGAVDGNGQPVYYVYRVRSANSRGESVAHSERLYMREGLLAPGVCSNPSRPVNECGQ